MGFMEEMTWLLRNVQRGQRTILATSRWWSQGGHFLYMSKEQMQIQMAVMRSIITTRELCSLQGQAGSKTITN